jgi:hypothetical protein
MRLYLSLDNACIFCTKTYDYVTLSKPLQIRVHINLHTHFGTSNKLTEVLYVFLNHPVFCTSELQIVACISFDTGVDCMRYRGKEGRSS